MLNRRRSMRTRSLIAGSLALAAALALGGCSSEEPDENKAASGSKVIAPGKPGEAAQTIPAEEARKATGDEKPNSADVMYAQMMIKHHEQAIVMTDLAPKRAESKKVKLLAERIKAAQKPEISMMEGWLTTKAGDPKEEKHAHDHGTMPGMATKGQLENLRAADGDAFDQLFIKLMITHHNGAVQMATDVLSDGNDILVEEMANDVVASQSAEIHRMREMP